MRTYKPRPKLMIQCVVCGAEVQGNRRRVFCSRACQMRNHRAEHSGRAKVGVPTTVRFRVLERDGYRCRYCGAGPEAKLTLDHTTPPSMGGKDTFENLVTACFACNKGKGNREASPPPL